MTTNDFLYDTFPPGFIWGMATSSYQTEGAWNEDGKGDSIWDRFCHEDPSRIKDKSNGDQTMDSYHKYKEDVRLLKNMNATSYRFSISWPRILPKGTLEVVNEKGIEYYNKLIDELLENGIEPNVTLFHWDLPQALQVNEKSGWLDEGLIQHFAEYARLCFKRFGDRVKHFVTFNEPWVFSMKAYDFATFAPGVKEPLEGPYQAVHTMLKAHAVAYQIYQIEFKEKQNGKIGLCVDSSNYAPMNPESTEDIQAAKKAYQFRIGWIVSPLLNGDYPEIMKTSIAERSIKEGRHNSRLPSFDSTYSKMLKGSVDFIGLNYYTAELVTPVEKREEDKCPTTTPGWNRDLGLKRIRDPSGRLCGAWWQHEVPHGLRNTLNWMKNEYHNFPIMITENGMSDTSDGVDDDDRVNFFRCHINEVLKAVKIDGVNVIGYLGWALHDVWEWADGYTFTFGVHNVDRNSPNFTRTPKKSAKYLAKIFKDNGFCKPDK